MHVHMPHTHIYCTYTFVHKDSTLTYAFIAWVANAAKQLQSGSGASALTLRVTFMRTDAAVQFDTRLTGVGSLQLLVSNVPVWMSSDANETVRGNMTMFEHIFP